jgi:hypothetical protein
MSSNVSSRGSDWRDTLAVFASDMTARQALAHLSYEIKLAYMLLLDTFGV